MMEQIKRVPMIAGNWKMYKSIAEARQLISELIPRLKEIQGVEKVVCPPYTSLLAVRALLEGTDIALGAQNLHWEQQGAFTGEISPVMLAELCKYVIIGHSERRTYFGETDQSVNKKIRAALDHGLIPIVCVGESLQENESGLTSEVVGRQITLGLSGIEPTQQPDGINLVVAYEPVWAIGTGKAATSETANSVISEIVRPALASVYDQQVASKIRILYGGSVKASNAAEYFKMSDIDGALVGGASLKAEEFSGIVSAAV